MSNLNLAIKEVGFIEDSLITCKNKGLEKLYVGISWICKGIGFNKNQKNRQIKNIQEDMILKQGVKFIKTKTNGGIQNALHLELNYLPIWLSKINTKSLDKNQYAKIIDILNWSLSDEFNNLKHPTKTFQWEGELRDEIFEIGYFNKYKIIDKEVSYSFGRVDLLAEDIDGETVVIELKKEKNYNDVVKQCNEYIDGFKREFNRVIKVVVCTLDNDKEFIKEAKSNNIEVYSYERQLKLNKVA